MGLLTGEAFGQLFHDFTRSAFHLELRDDYGVASELKPMQEWLNREPDEYAWVPDWHQLIKRATTEGKTVTRARVITEPVTDYIRFEHAVTRFNIAAGERVLWVPRQLTGDIDFPEHDFWLFDEETVAFDMFAVDGRSFGAQLVIDPPMVERCVMVRDHVLALGIPHEDYRLR